MSMIEDIKELGKLGYTKDEINQIIGFKAATTAPEVKEIKNEPEQKVEPEKTAEQTVGGLSLESFGIKPIEKAEEEAPQKTQTEVIDILRSMSAEIASLKSAQQVANTQTAVNVTPKDISIADMVSAFTEN
jgi:hypothetical protein